MTTKLIFRDRSEATAETWLDPEIRRKRSTHKSVIVNGPRFDHVHFKSVAQAFAEVQPNIGPRSAYCSMKAVRLKLTEPNSNGIVAAFGYEWIHGERHPMRAKSIYKGPQTGGSIRKGLK